MSITYHFLQNNMLKANQHLDRSICNVNEKENNIVNYG